jgi:electron transport complex protein RnfB
VDALAELLDVETLLLNEEFGENTTEHVVYVDEQVCIGCTLCIQACPVDAFVGASKVMFLHPAVLLKHPHPLVRQVGID